MNGLYFTPGVLDGGALVQSMSGCQEAWTPHSTDIDIWVAANGGGTVLGRSSWSPSVFHPAWWGFRQAGEIHVYISGTNEPQAFGAHAFADIAGYLFANPVFSGNVYPHVYFLSAGTAIYAQVKSWIDALPTGTITKVRFNGHSYGAAAAQLAAANLVNATTGITVECLAHGSPKPAMITASYPKMAGCWSIGHPLDPVPYMPPQGDAVYWNEQLSGVYAWFGVEPALWSNMGQAATIENGAIAQVQPVESAFGSFPSGWSWTYHQPNYYLQQYLLYRRNQLAFASADAYENFVNSINPFPAYVDPGPPPGQRTNLNAPTVNTVSFNQSDGALPLTSSNQSDTISTLVDVQSTTQISGAHSGGSSGMATLYKYSFFTSDSLLGHSTNMIFAAAGTLSAVQQQQVAGRWIAKFAALLSNGTSGIVPAPVKGSPRVVAYRVSLWNSPTQSQLVLTDGDPNAGPGVWSPISPAVQADYASDRFNAGIMCRVQSLYVQPGTPAKNWYRQSTVWIPSTPDPLVKADVVDYTQAIKGGQNWGVALAQLVTQLSSDPLGQWGHIGVDPGARVYQLTNATIGGTPTPSWKFVVDSPVGLSVRSLIQLYHANQRGWNGTYRITNIDGPTSTITIAGGPRPDALGFTSAQARLYRDLNGQYQGVFYAFQYVAPNGWIGILKPNVRTPAKPFSPVSFRRRSRGPKTSR